MKFLKVLIGAALLVLAVTFSMENSSTVTIKYYHLFPPIDAPLFLVILVSVLIGIAIGGVAGLIERFSLKNMIRKDQKTIAKLEKELTALRNLPITEGVPSPETEESSKTEG